MSTADPIEVVPYDPDWAARFETLGAFLRRGLGDVALRIDHIGSTAVVGLAAKPVVDVQISVASLEPAASFRAPLESLGLRFRLDNPDRTKRYFREPLDTARTHIHVRKAGSWSEQFALLFRDYVRVHPDDAARYAALKRELAARHRDDREAYTDAKTPLIWEIISRASQWSQDVGWVPGPSDA